MPTIAQFVARAKKQGCVELRLGIELTGARGKSRPRVLRGPSGNYVILAKLSRGGRLTPSVLEGYCRTLGILSRPETLN